MTRTLVIGDIHGGLRALHQIMERAKVTANDKLIFLGDYVDELHSQGGGELLGSLGHMVDGGRPRGAG